MPFRMQSLLLTAAALLSAAAIRLPAETAPDHIVAARALHQAVRNTAQERQGNLAKLDRFLSSEPARQALAALKLDRANVSSALSLLSDEELAELAARSANIERDIAAGALSNQQITYILIALGTAVLILVIVAAR